MNNIDNTVKELYEKLGEKSTNECLRELHDRIEAEAGRYIDEYLDILEIKKDDSKIARIDFPENGTRICQYCYDKNPIIEVIFQPGTVGVVFLLVAPEFKINQVAEQQIEKMKEHIISSGIPKNAISHKTYPETQGGSE